MKLLVTEFDYNYKLMFSFDIIGMHLVCVNNSIVNAIVNPKVNFIVNTMFNI